MNNDLRKALRDFLVSSVSLFFASFYAELNPSDFLSNFNNEVLLKAVISGLNSIWISVPTTLGLFLHRRMRPAKELPDTLETVQNGSPPDHL